MEAWRSDDCVGGNGCEESSRFLWSPSAVLLKRPKQPWRQNLLHNQCAQLLKLILLVRGNQRIIVINILGIYKLEGDGRSNRYSPIGNEGYRQPTLARPN